MRIYYTCPAWSLRGHHPAWILPADNSPLISLLLHPYRHVSHTHSQHHFPLIKFKIQRYLFTMSLLLLPLVICWCKSYNNLISIVLFSPIISRSNWFMFLILLNLNLLTCGHISPLHFFFVYMSLAIIFYFNLSPLYPFLSCWSLIDWLNPKHSWDLFLNN